MRKKVEKMNVEKWILYIGNLKTWNLKLRNIRMTLNNWISKTNIEKTNVIQIRELRRLISSNIEEIEYQLSQLVDK